MLDKDKCCMEFGGLVYKYRKLRGLTQETASTKMGILRTSLANIEAGRQNVTLFRLLQIASALDVDPKELIPVGGPNNRAVARVERARRRLKDAKESLAKATAKLSRR